LIRSKAHYAYLAASRFLPRGAMQSYNK